MKKKYITCPQCVIADYTPEARADYIRSSICPRCSNLRKVVDPQTMQCNMCAGSMCPNEKVLSGTWKSDEAHGLIDAKVSGGYESYHLFDCTAYVFSFCEKCLRTLFNQCKVPPVIADYTMPDYEDTYDLDQIAYDYRIWQGDGGHHQAYLDRKCNAIKACPNEAMYTIKISNNFTEDCACEEHKNSRNNCVNCTKVKFIPHVLKPFL